MKKTLETKLVIIENWIDHYSSNDFERERLKKTALQYVEEDHVDEIKQAFDKEIKNQYKIIHNKTGSMRMRFSAVNDEEAITIFKDYNLQIVNKEGSHVLYQFTLFEQLSENDERTVKI
jgi:hypothetical protein